jgi:hypothetical protein
MTWMKSHFPTCIILDSWKTVENNYKVKGFLATYMSQDESPSVAGSISHNG